MGDYWADAMSGINEAMYGLGFKSRPPPNFQALADKTNAQAMEQWYKTQTANHSNQYGPDGSSTWSTNPLTGQWEQRVSLSPELQAMKGANQQFGMGLLGAGQGLLGQSMSLQSPEAYRAASEKAFFDRGAARLDPMWAKREDQANTRLLNMGHDIDSAGYKGAMGDLGMQRNDAYSSLMNDAILHGGAEASRMFGMDLAGQQAKQQFGLNNLGMGLNILGATKVGNPQFGAVPQTGGPQGMVSPWQVGLAQDATLRAGDAQTAGAYQGFLSGLMDVGGSAASFGLGGGFGGGAAKAPGFQPSYGNASPNLGNYQLTPPSMPGTMPSGGYQLSSPWLGY